MTFSTMSGRGRPPRKKRPVVGCRRAAAADLVEAADSTVPAAPVDEANAALARQSRRLLALEGTDPPPAATAVSESELLAALSAEPSQRSTTAPR
jgi:hypothetical protein